MKKWKVYKVYAEDCSEVYRMIVPSPTKKEAEDFVRNCSLDIIKTTEIENFYLNVNMMVNVLDKAGFTEDECDVIMRLINMVGFGA